MCIQNITGAMVFDPRKKMKIDHKSSPSKSKINQGSIEVLNIIFFKCGGDLRGYMVTGPGSTYACKEYLNGDGVAHINGVDHRAIVPIDFSLTKSYFDKHMVATVTYVANNDYPHLIATPKVVSDALNGGNFVSMVFGPWEVLTHPNYAANFNRRMVAQEKFFKDHATTFPVSADIPWISGHRLVVSRVDITHQESMSLLMFRAYMAAKRGLLPSATQLERDEADGVEVPYPEEYEPFSSGSASSSSSSSSSSRGSSSSSSSSGGGRGCAGQADAGDIDGVEI